MKEELSEGLIDMTSSTVNQTSGAPTGMGALKSATQLSGPFWRNVEIRGDDECWPYTGHIDRDGYGKYQRHGAHREAFHLATGRRALFSVLHSCDNPPCCNPAHLREGTQADNIAECVSKNRHYWGSMTHCKRGHEFTVENTYRRSDGKRKCRACERKGVRLAVAS